jgi:hypothetical protein
MPGFQSRGSQQREDRQGCGTDDADIDDGEHAEYSNKQRQRHSQVELDVVPAPKIIADSAQYSGGRAIALLDAATT